MLFVSFLVLAGAAAAMPSPVLAVEARDSPSAAAATMAPAMPSSAASHKNGYHCHVLPNLNILSCLGLDNDASGFNVSLPVSVGGVADGGIGTAGIANGAASELGGVADGSADGTADGTAKGAASGAASGLGAGLASDLGNDLGGILGGDTDGAGVGGVLRKKD